MSEIIGIDTEARTWTCQQCGAAGVIANQGAAGYGIDQSDRAICYQCCGENERADMIATGRATLYLFDDGARRLGMPTASIANWPDTLIFPVSRINHGHHNIAGTRTDAWFTGPDGAPWWGVSYGENTQIIHCKRIKAR